MIHSHHDLTHFPNIKATFFVVGKMSKFGLLFLLVWSFVLFYSEIGRILHFASLWHALRRAWIQSQIYTFFTAVSHCFQDLVRSSWYVRFFFLNQTFRDRSEKDLAFFNSNISLLLWQQKSLGVALWCASKHLGVMCQNDPFSHHGECAGCWVCTSLLPTGLVQGGVLYFIPRHILALVGWWEFVSQFVRCFLRFFRKLEIHFFTSTTGGKWLQGSYAVFCPGMQQVPSVTRGAQSRWVQSAQWQKVCAGLFMVCCNDFSFQRFAP